MSQRAVRNNNPGNLQAGLHWQGLLPRPQMNAEQAAEPRFAVFASPKWGFRALAIVLLNYEKLHSLHTVEQIISRWAPPKENDTAAYIKGICHGMGVDPDSMIDVHNPAVLTSLCKAISIHESGGWIFTQHDLVAGVAMAQSNG